MDRKVKMGDYPRSPTGHKLTWIPDLPDMRDRLFNALNGNQLVVPAGTREAAAVSLRDLNLPQRVDLRQYASPVEDQGDLGSCTANAFAGAIEIIDKRKSHVDVSRLFIYYNERAYIGTTLEDSGAYIRDGIKSLVEHGWASEKQWPYDISKFTKKPRASVYKEAAKRKIGEYMRLNSLTDMKACLNFGYPFIFGFTVYDNFYDTGANGIVPMPRGRVQGGHAVLAVGYDDAMRRVIVRNSWGASWGDGGYCYMPYDYVAHPHLCDDFWMIKFL